jgi:hypothetical protein
MANERCGHRAGVQPTNPDYHYMDSVHGFFQPGGIQKERPSRNKAGTVGDE